MLTFIRLVEPARYNNQNYVILDEDGVERGHRYAHLRGVAAVSGVTPLPHASLSQQLTDDVPAYTHRSARRAAMYEGSGRAEDL